MLNNQVPQDMPSDPMNHFELQEACGVEPNGIGKQGALEANGSHDLKDNLKQFTENLHQKAAQVISWMGQIEPSASERAKR